MGLNNISRYYNEPRLSQSELVNEVLHHLLSIGLSGDSFISAEQIFDEKNPDSISIRFSYYDKEKGTVIDTINLKNIRILESLKENSLKGIDDLIFSLNRDRLRIEEEGLALKLSQAIKSGRDDFIGDRFPKKEILPIITYDDKFPKKEMLPIITYDDRFPEKEIHYIAKDGSTHTSLEGLNQANQEYKDRTYVKKPKFPEPPYIDTSIPPYKQEPDYIFPKFKIDDPESQGRIYPYKNPLNPDDKFSK